MGKKQLKEEIKKAIKAGNYKVYYNEPENIREDTKPNGDTFYVVCSMDDATSSTCFGSCIVSIADHEFENNWESGQWTMDDKPIKDEDEDILFLIESIPNLIFGEFTETDEQMSVYAKLNKLNINELEYYYSEQGDIPISIDNFKGIDEKGLDEVKYDDETYYILNDYYQNDDSSDRLAVCGRDEPTDDGSYPISILHYDEDGETITDVDETDDFFDIMDD